MIIPIGPSRYRWANLKSRYYPASLAIEGTTLTNSNASPQVAIVQQSLRRYRAGFYEALRDRLAQDGIELLLFHSTPAPEDDPRDDPLEVPWAHPLAVHRIGPRGRSVTWQAFTPELQQADLVIVEQATKLALNYRLLWRQRRGLVRLAFWGHGRNFGASARSGSERLKARISSRVHWWFAYNDLAARVVRGHGVPAERITVVNNTIDTSTLAEHLRQVDAVDKASLRQQLGLGEGPVGLFVGTLRETKRLDVLFRAAELVRAARPDFQLIVIGSGPLQESVRHQADTRPWVHYLGSLYGRDRATALALADLMLVPAAVGLVVVDALVSSVPLVTSLEGPHGPEISYLQDGRNGRIVPDGLDPAIYAAVVLELLDDEQRGALMAGCRQDAPNFSVEAMAERFAAGIREALDEPLELRHARPQRQ